jgi:hypothetical protein
MVAQRTFFAYRSFPRRHEEDEEQIRHLAHRLCGSSAVTTSLERNDVSNCHDVTLRSDLHVETESIERIKHTMQSTTEKHVATDKDMDWSPWAAEFEVDELPQQKHDDGHDTESDWLAELWGVEKVWLPERDMLGLASQRQEPHDTYVDRWDSVELKRSKNSKRRRGRQLSAPRENRVAGDFWVHKSTATIAYDAYYEGGWEHDARFNELHQKRRRNKACRKIHLRRCYRAGKYDDDLWG